ncbi:acyl-CoA synthetase (AMP-forming)/AMP-acid ligase II [Sphingomonas naasensis]|uniref:4-coumarate--CoA ligase n=1 Tax=Sphingomonas naasensis TaxID=1344951 RepID=A0A4V3QWX7_9SPHN|nr:class I adenylate-forming enzyme family protein [Sphingomonas naasensis]NIJ20119.1 acyl-CoA synthetase (AMP-forming)/AMP-acid ligase II [Sphingomonas naasensis]TGX44272.1 4-coumarate--CoA ligase [Sphingomonas naasensis]
MGEPDASAATMLASDFAALPDLIRAHGRERGDKPAIIFGERVVSYAVLDRLMDDIAFSLQRDGVEPGDAVAILGPNMLEYLLVFLGTLRAGCVAAPLAPSATPEQLAAMVADCGAPILFHDAAHAIDVPVRKVYLEHLLDWIDEGVPAPVRIAPGDAFNIIYSSGTTGTPKGIVQPHAMRWVHIGRAPGGFGEAVTMVATPLYSNTTLVSVLPTLGWGGTVVLMAKFDARDYLTLAEKHRGTLTMLVPVQYRRIMADPEFDRFDLSSFTLKTCTSAPFPAALKADILARWPGLLVEYYGMTEGGGTTALVCNAHPDKLHTVGKPLEGQDIRLIDDDGREVPQGEVGEVVGRSGAMMTGYHGRPDATDAATWYDEAGNRFIRHGDIGRFDEDGFLTLLDRKKDLIISGGFNVYPSDLEAVLVTHPDVVECSVVGMPSEQWGETPVGFYVGAGEPAEILGWCNAKLGKTQRLADLVRVDALPRSAIGKVLKRELRDRYSA